MIVLRYHLESCHKEGLKKEEVAETLGIATLIGGTLLFLICVVLTNIGMHWKPIINKLFRYISRQFALRF